MSMRQLTKLVLLLPLVGACNPVFDDRFSDVESLRVLAVQSTPAEVAPKGTVTYQTLVVDPRGTIDSPNIDWSFCTQSKPVNELNDVASACFGTGDNVTPFATGGSARGKIPNIACRQFGPDLPVTLPGAPSARPTDADTTGGYYQPVILAIHGGGGVSSLAETRLTCSLANSTGAQDQEYAARTKPNENPQLSSVVATSMGDAPLTDVDDPAPLLVAHGQDIVLRAAWPSCPEAPVCGDGMCTSGETLTDCPDDCTKPVGCNGPEEYAYLDPAQGALVDRHESMRVSWFSNSGIFKDDHTGRLEGEHTTTTTDDTWTAPSTPGNVLIWVVLRDDRGGVDFHSYQVQVQ